MSPPPDVASDRRRVWILAFFVATLTLISYVYGWSVQGARPDLGRFIGFGYNLDDGFVYLSWMRQAADGHFFQSNLFTSELQSPRLFNLFFLLLGNVARFSHLPLVVVYHLARVVACALLIRAVWWLAEMWIPDRRARWAAILLLCFSAGFGWIPGLWHEFGETGPIDIWQPEAVTFFSIYLNPLFTVSMLLMAGTIGWLWIARRDGNNRAAAYSGICGFLLGNIHTYDVITVALVWLVFLAVIWIRDRTVDRVALLQAIIAGIPTALSTGYNLFVLRTDPLFAARANVATLTAPILHVLLGYGILVPLAVFAAFKRMPAQSKIEDPPSPPFTESLREPSHPAMMLIVLWVVANLAAAYLPVPFQRKMLMGEHIPLCLLAGQALAVIPARAWVTAVAGLLAFTSLTNWRILARDIASFRQNSGQSRIQRTYLFDGEVATLNWLREHAPEGAVIQPMPWTQPNGSKVGISDTTLAAAVPGYTGHPVDAGHWGETPSFGEAMGKWVRFMMERTTDEERQAILRQTRVKYLVFTQRHGEFSGESLPFFLNTPPPYLHRVDEASNSDADVYEVRL